jgi:hypothetical protein
LKQQLCFLRLLWNKRITRMKWRGKKHRPKLRTRFLGIKVIRLPPEQITACGWGDATWTASNPAEVVVLYAYNGTAVSNQTVSQFGEPLTAPFGGGRSSNHSREWDACELWKYELCRKCTCFSYSKRWSIYCHLHS